MLLKKKSMFLVVSALFISHQVFAKPCTKVNRRSCWHVKNNSSHMALNMHCVGRSNPAFTFSSSNLGPQKIYSEQYNMGWGDGLGFPEPGVPVSCEFNYKGYQAHLNFITQDWGERAQFEVNQKEVVLTTQGWSSEKRVIKQAMSKSQKLTESSNVTEKEADLL